MITPASKRVLAKLHIKSESFGYRVFQMIRTTLLVIIGELFFRAQGIKAGFSLLRRIFTGFSFTGMNEETMKVLGVDWQDLLIVGITLIMIFTVSVMNERGVCLRDTLAKKKIVLRWCVLYALAFYIIIFGAYGFGYLPVDPMYAQF